jgi:hypothetical protein
VLRRLLAAGDAGTHIAPDKMTIAQWVDDWLVLKDYKEEEMNGGKEGSLRQRQH